ncbi:MAG: cold shock domain-containing protein [Vicinamibacterales bacterium]
MPKPSIKTTRPVTRPSVPATGRIVTLWTGQGHGVIRTTEVREVFFHRGDVEEGTSFSGLQVGDTVAFDLLEDKVSGARAQRVRLYKG